MKQNDVGVFLHRVPYSESSLIVHYFTKNNGIQKFIFQGAKKKKGTHLAPLGVHELTYYLRPDSELGKLIAADHAIVLNEITFNPVKSIVAYFIAEVIRQTIKTNQRETALFHFIEKTILELENEKINALFPLQFMCALSFHLGIEPQFNNLEAKYFNLIEGEFTLFKNNYDLIYEGDATNLIKSIYNEQVIDSDKHTQQEALQQMIQYFEMHIPNAKIQKPLKLLQEIFYA